MSRSTPFLLTALLATSLFTPRVFGQVRNTNQSRRLGSVIVGGWGNLISSNSTNSSIGGGFGNVISNSTWYAAIGGGLSNKAGMLYASVGGGRENIASGVYGTVAGGGYNQASGDRATVGGGVVNNAWSTYSTIGGGCGNRAGIANGVADFATVGGGLSNYAQGTFSTIPGGTDNTASGFCSFSAGQNAKATNDNSFVWSDTSDTNGFGSFRTNTFNVRASGGLFLDNTTSMYFGNGKRQMLNLYDQTYGIGVQTDALYFRTGDLFYWFRGGSHTNTTSEAGTGGTQLMRLDGSALWVYGDVYCDVLHQSSDRNVKQDIRPLDPKAVLQKVAALPISQWSYKASPTERHYGPMAQDFRAAFGVGKDEKTIAMVDADGVALASIQGLVEELKERDKAIDKLKEQNKNLSRSIEKINERLNSLPPTP